MKPQLIRTYNNPLSTLVSISAALGVLAVSCAGADDTPMTSMPDELTLQGGPQGDPVGSGGFAGNANNDGLTSVTEVGGSGGDDSGADIVDMGAAGSSVEDPMEPSGISGNAVWHEDFESMPSGSDWHNDSMLVIQDGMGVNGSRGLRVTYDLRSNPTGTSRHQFRQPVPPANEYTLQYDIFFEKDWTTSMGGKFHGLTPETHVTGCKTVMPDRWSARVVFDDRRPYLYLYDQEKSSSCGRKLTDSPTTFQNERWYAVSLYVRVNTEGNEADGVARIYADGKLQAEFPAARFAGEIGEHTKIQNFLFSTFLGGSGEGSFRENQHVRFDKFAVVPGESIRQRAGE